MSDYLEINKKTWNSRLDSHVNSDFYDMPGFLNGKTSLKSIELELLGDLTGKKVLHLQCHFGQDSISLARMGAEVTAVDLSNEAIEKGREIAKQTGANVNFICCDVYSLKEHLDEQFDLVFTSYGVIGWLPDMDKWANIIQHFLKPNGQLVFIEFHPVVWMFDDNFDKVGYNYFNDGPIEETQSGTYADRDADLELVYVMWNHGMSEVVNALIGQGLSIRRLNEYDYSPYNCFNKTIEFEPGKFRIEHMDNKIPMVYAIVAEKVGGV